MNKLVDLYNKAHENDLTDEDVLENVAADGRRQKKQENAGGIVVYGVHDVAVRFSKCCNPIPGDEIVGFVTRGRGITIHTTDCVNIINLPESERARLIEAEWHVDEEEGQAYSATIKVYARNRTGLLVDISRVFTERKIDMSAVNVRTSRQGTATVEVSFEIHSREELAAIMDRVRQVNGVEDIERSRG